MDEKPELIKKLEKKYIKTYEISDFKDLLEKVEQRYAKDIAFKVKEDGKIDKVIDDYLKVCG